MEATKTNGKTKVTSEKEALNKLKTVNTTKSLVLIKQQPWIRLKKPTERKPSRCIQIKVVMQKNSKSYNKRMIRYMIKIREKSMINMARKASRKEWVQVAKMLEISSHRCLGAVVGRNKNRRHK